MNRQPIAMVVSAIGISAFALSGCGAKVNTSVQTTNSGTTNASITGSGSASNTSNSTTNSASTNTTNTTPQNTTQPSDSGTSNTPKDVIQAAVKSISNTSIPIMAPKSLPIPSTKSRMYLTAKTTLSSTSYNVKLITTSHPYKVNSTSMGKVSPKNNLISFGGTKFKTSSDAHKYLLSLRKNYGFNPTSKQGTVNLGNGITARKGGALHNTTLQWNEGNWNLEVVMNSNSGVTLAKQMVSYLHTHMLPAPKDKGIVVAWQGTPQFDFVAWQEGNVIYRVAAPGYKTHSGSNTGFGMMDMLQTTVGMIKQ